VVHGLFFGRIAPSSKRRRAIKAPAMVVGHPADPIHPAADAAMLAEEMPNAHLVNANSILEWRLRPDRLTDEFSAWLDEIWTAPEATPARSPRKGRAAGDNGQPPQAVTEG
jgi:pimeloyl-ACP methyl ester carboxylesterase